MEYLGKVHGEYGVESITIANPLYIREVRKRFPDLEICASVLGDIDCVEKAVIFKPEQMSSPPSISTGTSPASKNKKCQGLK
jgi:collagenase-like PrtC family protease